MPNDANAVVRRLVKPAVPPSALAGARLKATVKILTDRYPGNPSESVRRSVALLYEALAGLFSERYDGTYPNPHAFRFPLEIVAQATVALARRRGSDVRTIDLLEVRAIIDALIGAQVLSILEAADPAAPEPSERGATLSFMAPENAAPALDDESANDDDQTAPVRGAGGKAHVRAVSLHLVSQKMR